MDHALLALCALLVNIAIAGPRRFYASIGLQHTNHYPAKLLRAVERKLNRAKRSDSDRRLRGFVIAGVLIAIGLCTGWIASLLFQHNLKFIEIIILVLLLPVRPVWDRAADMRRALQKADLAGGRAILDPALWRHNVLLDEHGLARASIETLSVQFAEKIVSPLFWYIALGLPGLFASAAITLLHDTVAPLKDDRHFAGAAQSAYTLVHFIPSRLTAVLWLVSSLFMPLKGRFRALGTIGSSLTHCPPRRLAITSAAAALGLSLGGPTSAFHQPWTKAGNPKATSVDIQRALYSYMLMLLLLFLWLGLLA